ncbi:hypothetical protein BJF89_13855 [Corynebacterium sp. CNJ-954]|uniref:metallophosphoesterase n=1 Tax=Corynebacterium sp. CNJ-954 TaxID=1904962 RepID=UPI000959C886|nr:metallophosphoesterase [Corynebacterium sp. CNJ-954]OLT55867.1 hypothetical protein BJF89_13855 [Corynebacterium sp. CNJ-954]
MTDWFTADLHLGHEAVASIRDMSNDEHTATIYENLVSATNSGDRLFILGDLVSGFETPEDEIQRVARLAMTMNRYNVKVHVIAGNHDCIHPKRSKAHRYLYGYSYVVDSVASAGTLKIAGQRAVLSHYPYDGDHTGEDRDIQWRARDLGAPIIHGHTHASEPVSWSRQGTLQICVSLDAWDMRPVSKDELARLIERNQKKENG